MITRRLPSWTWWFPFFIILAAKQLSYITFYGIGVHYVYLPHLIGTALFFLWGPRICLSYFIAESFTGSLAGVNSILLSPLVALISTVKAYMGYFLYTSFFRQKSRSETIKIGQFFVLVLLLPNLVCNYLIVAQFIAVGTYAQEQFRQNYYFITLADLLGGMIVTYPLIKWLAPWLKKRGFSQWPEAEV